MKCEHCGQNEAEIELPSFNGGKIKLCKHCADLKSKNNIDLNMSVHDLFGGIMKLSEKAVKDINVACSSCGLTFENFRDIGRLGCPNCYAELSDQLEPILKKLHGTTKHRGKRPVYLRKGNLSNEMRVLKRQLKLAIKKEEYERAAKIRDELKILTGDSN